VAEEEEEMELVNMRRLVASYDMGKLTRDPALCGSVFRFLYTGVPRNIKMF
jgi:hypothetical protein